jgi:hypothetical protein
MIEFNLKKAISAAVFLLCGTIFVFAQSPILMPTPDLDTIVKNADAQAQKYRNEFRNLLSEEVKTFEMFEKDGDVKKRTVIQSNFIIYQSSKDESVATEYRNVFKVDGKPVGDSEKRTIELFEKIAKSDSLQDELERIRKEGSRYDKTLEINGLTLLQTPILTDYSRPYFNFKLAGRENLSGREVFIVEYQQTKASPYVLLNEESTDGTKVTIGFNLELPNQINKFNVFLRGKLWIDAQTFQIWRENRELTAQVKSNEPPLLLIQSDFEYQPSDFGILAPKRITFSYFEVKTKDKGREISTILDTKATFEYAKFSKSDVEVKSNEINSPKNR